MSRILSGAGSETWEVSVQAQQSDHPLLVQSSLKIGYPSRFFAGALKSKSPLLWQPNQNRGHLFAQVEAPLRSPR